jgi:hypothetical protein
MKRNYAFDRSRYFLPVAAATNVMLIMSARGWVNLCQYLLSNPLPECRRLGDMIQAELAIAAPRMTKYAKALEPNQKAIQDEFQKLVRICGKKNIEINEAGVPYLDVLLPPEGSENEMANDLKYHANRYAPVGSYLQRTCIRFGWSRVAFAEIRDLNRHRTGTKYCPQVPSGFYCAMDQLPAGADGKRAFLEIQAALGKKINDRAQTLLECHDCAYIYWTLLGTEFPFEHITTADKFIYEAELRTGVGAHYCYAKHLRDALSLWYQRFEQTKGLILEGSAEPE